MATQAQMIGASIRSARRTFGLRPPEDYGPIETVAEYSTWNGTVRTVEGNTYLLADYLIIAFAPQGG